MKKLGIAVNNLGASQLNYFLVKNANSILLREPLLDVTAFIENQVPACLPANFAVMPMYEAWGYDGVVVATSFTTAQKLLAFPCPAKKFFYVWDLEWVRPFCRRTYREWASVYRDPRLQLITRGPDHTKVIREAWGRDTCREVPDCDLAQLLEVAG